MHEASIKIMINSALFIVLLGTHLACDPPIKADDSKYRAEEQNEGKFSDKQKEKQAQFLVDAAEINLMEIRLGELAVSSSKTAEIRDLGNKLRLSHIKLLGELKEIAAKKMVTIPDSLTLVGQNTCARIANFTDASFDKEYCDVLVSSHKEAIELFEKATTENFDEDVKSWANATLPVLRKHFDMAMTSQNKFKDLSTKK